MSSEKLIIASKQALRVAARAGALSLVGMIGGPLTSANADSGPPKPSEAIIRAATNSKITSGTPTLSANGVLTIRRVVTSRDRDQSDSPKIVYDHIERPVLARNVQPSKTFSPEDLPGQQDVTGGNFLFGAISLAAKDKDAQSENLFDSTLPPCDLTLIRRPDYRGEPQTTEAVYFAGTPGNFNYKVPLEAYLDGYRHLAIDPNGRSQTIGGTYTDSNPLPRPIE